MEANACDIDLERREAVSETMAPKHDIRIKVMRRGIQSLHGNPLLGQPIGYPSVSARDVRDLIASFKSQ
jgi:hypothetical protein